MPFRLPWQNPRINPVNYPLHRHTTPMSKAVRILLAEDNAVNRQVVIRLLEKRGHVITVATDGAQAVAMTRKSSFDLVLMDIQMPGMDGYEATAVIRKDEESTGKHLPIIAMTAHAMEGDRQKCLAAGMDDFVAKPIRVDELVKIIENHDRTPQEAAEPEATRKLGADRNRPQPGFGPRGRRH